MEPYTPPDAETERDSEPQVAALSKVQTSQEQIRRLLSQPSLTRVTAATLANQIEAALRGVPATDGNRLPEPLQTMQDMAEVLRRLAPTAMPDPAVLREPELRLRIAQLEALVERLAAQLHSEKAAREATEALLRKDSVGKQFTKGLAWTAGSGSAVALAVALHSTGVHFLGGTHPLMDVILARLGRLLP